MAKKTISLFALIIIAIIGIIVGVFIGILTGDAGNGFLAGLGATGLGGALSGRPARSDENNSRVGDANRQVNDVINDLKREHSEATGLADEARVNDQQLRQSLESATDSSKRARGFLDRIQNTKRGGGNNDDNSVGGVGNNGQ